MLSAIQQHKSVDLRIPQKKRIQNYIYETEKRLGKGCFSTVHPGVHLLSNEAVAIKIIKLASVNNPKMKKLLDQETQIICSLNHPNIIRCYEVLRSNNHCYFATQLCEQGSLEKSLHYKKRYNQDEVRPILTGINQGLLYLESQGIVHRDLKIANVLFKKGTAKIADFGFAVRTRNQFKDIRIGSPLYMAPEALLRGIYSPKTDIWSFGVLIYELLHGKTPYSHCRSQIDLKTSVLQEITELQLRKDLSPEIKQLILSCLKIQQEERPSIVQLQNLAYFRYVSKNGSLSNERNIRAASPCFGNSTKPMFLSNVARSPKKYERNNVKALTMFSPSHSNFITGRQLSSFKKTYLKEISVEQSTNNSSFCSIYQPSLIKGKLNLRESIGLIHFCRLGFKLLTDKKSFNLPKGAIKALIIKIMQDIQGKMQTQELIFTQNELIECKNKKLKDVVLEYFSRYRAVQVPDQIMDFRQITRVGGGLLKSISYDQNQDTRNYSELLRLFLSFIQKLEDSIKSRQYTAFSPENTNNLELYLQSL